MASQPDPNDELKRLLIELNLTTLARDWETLRTRAEKAMPSYTELMRMAMEAERAARQERAIQRRRRWSRLGPPLPLDKFDYAARPKLTPSVVKELATCRFVEEKRNLIFVGRPSTGKTTIAKALGHAACERRMSVYYSALGDMLASLRASKADGTYRKALRRITQPDLLVIDDCGFSSLDPENANELFRVVCARYRQRSTVVATNLPFKQWGEFLPSPALAVAIADRLVDDATILRFTGKPFRLPRDIIGDPLDDE